MDFQNHQNTKKQEEEERINGDPQKPRKKIKLNENFIPKLKLNLINHISEIEQRKEMKKKKIKVQRTYNHSDQCFHQQQSNKNEKPKRGSKERNAERSECGNICFSTPYMI